ncbi:formyl transferase [Candidatus Woesearchaeota archaeon]|nr:formyl transferase [Candidatus Woesearchaeota archaeon]
MILKPLHNPSSGPMRVVGLMSGSGSNLTEIIKFEKRVQQQRGQSPYTVVGIFSDRATSSAVQIGATYDLPVVVRDLKSFYAARGKPRSDMGVRKEFDAATVRALAPFTATVAAYAGYMSIATNFLLEAYQGVNVHPADLSILEGERRKYTGDHAVRDAILAGELYLRSCTHVLEEKVDYGKIFMRSAPVKVQLPVDFDPKDQELVQRVVDEHQNRLKKEGDWIIFPQTLLLMAEGRIAQDEQGNLYVDKKAIPNGLIATRSIVE